LHNNGLLRFSQADKSQRTALFYSAHKTVKARFSQCLTYYGDLGDNLAKTYYHKNIRWTLGKVLRDRRLDK